MVERLREGLGTRVELETIFWEDEPLLATGTFQEQIPSPAEALAAVEMRRAARSGA